MAIEHLCITIGEKFLRMQNSIENIACQEQVLFQISRGADPYRARRRNMPEFQNEKFDFWSPEQNKHGRRKHIFQWHFMKVSALQPKHLQSLEDLGLAPWLLYSRLAPLHQMHGGRKQV